jgi:hypothetical protein
VLFVSKRGRFGKSRKTSRSNPFLCWTTGITGHDFGENK